MVWILLCGILRRRTNRKVERVYQEPGCAPRLTGNSTLFHCVAVPSPIRYAEIGDTRDYVVDVDRVVYNSWTIAEYLEETYADRPSLFGGPAGQALSRFVTDWVDAELHPEIVRMLATDIYAHLHKNDLDYFRKTREERFGMTLFGPVC